MPLMGLELPGCSLTMEVSFETSHLWLVLAAWNLPA